MLKKLQNVEIRDWLILLGLLVGSLVLYIWTGYRGISGGDSGEIAASVVTSGVPHSTGFPLYIVFGKLFLLFPFQTPAFGLIVLSSAFAALTATTTFLALRVLNIHRIPSLSASAALVFSSSLWSHAGAVRVYALAGFFTALLFLIIALWLRTKDSKFIFLFAVLFGLALGTHLFVLAAGVSFFAVLLFQKRRLFVNKKVVLFSLLLFLIPLAQYALLPILSSQAPPVNFGNLTESQSFFDYITQQDYRFKTANRTLESVTSVLGDTLFLFANEFTFPALLFVIIGATACYKKNKPLFIGLTAMLGFNVLMMTLYGNQQDLVLLFRYYVPAYLSLAFFIGIGMQVLWMKTASSFKKNTAIFLTILLFSWPIFPALAHFHQSDRRNNAIVQNFAMNVLKSLKPASILISSGDSLTGPLWYLQATGGRTDVVVIDKNLLTRDWYIAIEHKKHPEIILSSLSALSPEERLPAFVESNKDKPIFSSSLLGNLPGAYRAIPHGLVYAITTNPGDVATIARRNAELWQSYRYSGVFDPGISKDYFEKNIIDTYSAAHNNAGVFYAANGLLEKAVEEYRDALRFKSSNEYAQDNLQRILEVHPDL